MVYLAEDYPSASIGRAHPWPLVRLVTCTYSQAILNGRLLVILKQLTIDLHNVKTQNGKWGRVIYISKPFHLQSKLWKSEFSNKSQDCVLCRKWEYTIMLE